LKTGDRVIVTGLMKAHPGAQVKVQEVDTQAQKQPQSDAQKS
jgi:membrane fusion protein (multidrug efflux system)